MTLRYLSVCSGIEAATVAWKPLGFEAAAFSEIEKFPRTVLQHHWPDIPLHGDFTTIKGNEYGPVDILVGGTPCQSFSIAGKRLGLDDPRGNLALEYIALARRSGARWIVWENVPGVLSSDGGRDFGTLLAAFAGHSTGRYFEPRGDKPGQSGTWNNSGIVAPAGPGGYGLAYRVLDAQYVRVDGFARAVPQRRRRVILVGYLGDWRPAAAVLSEPEGMRGDPAPSRETGESVAGTLKARASVSGGRGGVDVDEAAGGGLQPVTISHDVSPAVTSKWAKGTGGPSGDEAQNLVAHTLSAEGFDASEDGTGRGTPLVPVIGFHGSQDTIIHGDKAGPVARNQGQENCIAFHKPVATQYAVRRLTPRECERLQGFPDDHTMIPWRGKPAELCPDGPRYKAIGNSMSVNVMRWVGQRIQLIHQVLDCESND